MIRPIDLLGSAARALRSNPLRSALTALGVIIGVASVVAMVSLGRGAQASVQASISSLGSNLIIVFPGSFRGGGGVRGAAGAFDTLTLADAEAIKREITGLAAVAPSQRGGGQLVAEGLNWNSRVEGVTPDYLIARDLQVETGRFFEEREDRQARKVVVLGSTVARELYPNLDPIGATVRMNGGAYEVIGVLESEGQAGFGQDQDDIVLAPLTTVKRRVSGRSGRADTISQIAVKTQRQEDLTRVQEEITELLRQRHHVQGEDDDFSVQNLASIMEAANAATATFTALLAGISTVSLLVGGIGIMNIMLVSVTERTREIGLRKALGARKADILQQFGVEAIALSVAGGLVGLLIGALAAWLITSLANLPLTLSPDTALMAIGFSALVGIVFGAYPAWRAAELDPIEALRRE